MANAMGLDSSMADRFLAGPWGRRALLTGGVLVALMGTPSLAQQDFQDPFASPTPAPEATATPAPVAEPTAEPTPFRADVITPSQPGSAVDVRAFPAQPPANSTLAGPDTAPPLGLADPFGLPPGGNGVQVTPLTGNPGFGVGPGGIQQPLPMPLQPQPQAVPLQVQQQPSQPQMTDEERALNEAYRQQMPLSPEEILRYGQERNAVQRAGAQIQRPPGTVPPYRSVDINLEPGVEPPILFTGVGEVTAVAFFDITGAPYPLASVVVGNPARFSVAVPNDGGNLLTITPLEPYAFGNIVVSLLDQPVPIVIKMRAGEGRVDYRVDMRVAARGPQAPDQALVPDTDPRPSDPALSIFLDGLNVTGAKVLRVSGGPALAWLYNGNVYMRTGLTILSPGWIQRAAGPSGTYVYQLPSTPVLRAADDGQLVTLRLEGLDD